MIYNYVVFGSEADFYKASYADLNSREDAAYLWKPIDTDHKFINLLYRFHTSPTINSKVKLPFQRVWNKALYHREFNHSKPICFVFFAGRKREVENGLPEYLRKKYPDCKIILFYQDMVNRSLLPNIEKIRDRFDMILSFDQLDAKKYQLHYYPLVYSPVEIPDNDEIKPCDVYFVGKAKDRLDKIISAYERFRDAGLRCDFHITGVDEKDQKYKDEIAYHGQMPYMENLQRIRACKCMLEIMQQGGHGYTLRYCEAIMYDKKIITDNPEVGTAPFYSAERIQVFKNPDEIETDFVLREPAAANYNYKENLSPVHLLEYIDKWL